jgi:predicted Zn-dependent protease
MSLRTEFAAIAVTLSLALALGCATSPTGRRQLKLLSDAEIDKMGVDAFQEMKAKGPISENRRANRLVRCVADAITAQLPAPYASRKWEVVVFDEETPNAFALPGGKIGVHTGLLSVAESQGQLATVIGHEVAHVIAGHSNERASHQIATGTAAAVAAEVAGPLGEAAVGAGAQLGLLLPFSRTQEAEADVLGLEYMARAGFDPTESVVLWQNMERASDGAPPEFLSTHPSGGTRIRGLQGKLPEMIPLYNQAREAGRRPDC